ncbi:hypothetical protein HDU79_001340 [Rhizoclosmatium sp. JEL0117]|nr:hypothetical protein HDU79_001340 [Rhizoclosmatium sp. JEL0117]
MRVANNDDPTLRESEGVDRGVRHIGIKNLSDEPLFTHTFKYKQRSELVRDGIIPARVPNQKRANRYSSMLDSFLPPPLPNTFFHTRYHDLDSPIASTPKPAPRPHSNYTPRPPSTPAPRLGSSFTISPIVWDLKATPLPNGSLGETPNINATIAPKRRASSSSPIDWHIPPKKRLISDSPAIATSAEPSLPILPSFSSFVNSTVKLEDDKNPFMTSNSSYQITQNVVQEAGAVAIHGHKRQTQGQDGPEQEGPSNQQSKKAKSDVEVSRLE